MANCVCDLGYCDIGVTITTRVAISPRTCYVPDTMYTESVLIALWAGQLLYLVDKNKNREVSRWLQVTLMSYELKVHTFIKMSAGALLKTSIFRVLTQT